MKKLLLLALFSAAATASTNAPEGDRSALAERLTAAADVSAMLAYTFGASDSHLSAYFLGRAEAFREARMMATETSP